MIKLCPICGGILCRIEPAVYIKAFRTGNDLIAARNSWKSGARTFSFWRENFLLPGPKEKSSRAMFCGTVNGKIPERKSAECEMGEHNETIKKDCTQTLLDAAPVY